MRNSHSNRHIIIADDITGAAEIAGICLRYGLRTSFAINEWVETDADFCIVCTDSRSLSANEAKALHLKLAQEIAKSNECKLFKKCDSALRGHIVAEIEALFETFDHKKVLFVPVNPTAGRVIRNGKYYIHNVLIEETAFAIDPDFPAFSSEVMLRIKKQQSIHNDNFSVYEDLSHFRYRGMYIPNCETLAELQLLAQMIDDDTIPCGSGAFFEAYLNASERGNVKTEVSNLQICNNFILVSGSTQSSSLVYAQQLSEQNVALAFFPEELLGIAENDFALNAFAQEIIAIYQSDRKVIVKLSEEKIHFANSQHILKTRLSKVINKVLQACSPEFLLIEGGATAYDIMREAQISHLTPTLELAPGVVMLRAQSSLVGDIIIKPGSYDWPITLLCVHD